jgi:hypothetical protein
LLQFASGHFTTDEYAIKFFTDANAFEREAEMYCERSIRAMMPSIAVVESNAGKRVTGPGGYVFPPFIVVEKGESLDEWVLRVQPDFVTILQVLAPQPPATPVAARCSVHTTTAAQTHAGVVLCLRHRSPTVAHFQVHLNESLGLSGLSGGDESQRTAGCFPEVFSLVLIATTSPGCLKIPQK